MLSNFLMELYGDKCGDTIRMDYRQGRDYLESDESTKCILPLFEKSDHLIPSILRNRDVNMVRRTHHAINQGMRVDQIQPKSCACRIPVTFQMQMIPYM